MNSIKWIKITTDIFDDEKIALIEQLPDADSIIVIWFKLLVIAGKKNACGMVYITKDIPYDVEKLAIVFKRPINTMRLALKTFQEFGMIEIENDIIMITNWEKHQNVDGLDKIREQNRIRQEKHRQKQLEHKNNVISRDSNAIEENRIEENRIYNTTDSAIAEPVMSEKKIPKKPKSHTTPKLYFGCTLDALKPLYQLAFEYSYVRYDKSLPAPVYFDGKESACLVKLLQFISATLPGIEKFDIETIFDAVFRAAAQTWIFDLNYKEWKRTPYPSTLLSVKSDLPDKIKERMNYLQSEGMV